MCQQIYIVTYYIANVTLSGCLHHHKTNHVHMKSVECGDMNQMSTILYLSHSNSFAMCLCSVENGMEVFYNYSVESS